MSDLVADRTGYAEVSRRDRPTEVDRAVAALSAGPLTVDAAVRLALLNNRTLAVQLESVGVATADFVTAAQVRNPELYVAFRPPDRGPDRATDIEATMAQDVLDVLLLPVRKRLAQAALDQSAVRAADAAVQLVHDVRVAYWTYAAADQALALQRQQTDAADLTAEYAGRLFAAGNTNELDLANQRADAAQARVDLLRLNGQREAARLALNRLLGLTDAQARWTAADPLPPPAGDVAAVGTLVDLALKRRLDVVADENAVALAEQAVGLTRAGLLTQISVGVDLEREPNKQVVIGPSLGLDVPIWNQHQGQIQRAEAEARQARAAAHAARLDVETEVRQADARLAAAGAAVDVADTALVPQRAAVTEATQRHYNGMLVGLYQLLAAKRAELTARQSAVELREQYWVARADLDRAVGR